MNDLSALAELPTRDLWYGTDGPRNARIMILGEAWGRTELEHQRPFVGESGRELDRMLAEAGIARKDCFITNVAAVRPERNEMFTLFAPEGRGQTTPLLAGLRPGALVQSELSRLYEQILTVKPSVIIALGNYALWAISDYVKCKRTSPHGRGGERYLMPFGIASHRGSMHFTSSILPGVDLPQIPLLPTIHPSAVLRQWDLRPLVIHDLRRAERAFRGDWRPQHAPTILAPPTFGQAMNRFQFMLRRADHAPLRIAADIETARGLITCIGFCDDPNFAMAVPFVRLRDEGGFESYWSPDDEAALLSRMREVFLHPNVLVEGQNFIYDTQYIQHWFGVTPRLSFDTMLAHHLVFPGTPKDLGHLSSLYCSYHWYWKEDAKEWDLKGSLESLLQYNALDNLRTYEIAGVLRKVIADLDLEPQWAERLEVNNLCLRMMNRGVRIDKARRAQTAVDVAMMISTLRKRLEWIIPPALVDDLLTAARGRKASPTPWYTSPDKQKFLFGEVLGVKLPRSRKTGSETLGKEGLEDLRVQRPELKLMWDLLSDIRSLGVFQNNFIAAPLDLDGRMRCSFNPGGTETFRLSSSENAFGRGTNLQNLPVGDDK